ncbi:protein TolR [Mesorhizobium sp. RP14(2022)]|uniref:Protein TolR n=1 Tax=Mesorhizobium liriopis TaxID=2953882 RepID=A0ABT1C034_9HYPH|nr:protein TolR [Mesorhizobium liriopis]MCO6048190.1 protein TolR [Mesorhizobium liriopis]
MGMSVGAAGGGRGRRGGRRSRKHGVMSEINVTPFVDVMLVLLIIFMVAAPMLTVGVPVDLPKAQAETLNSETQPIVVSIRQGGAVYLNETEIPVEELAPKMQAVAKAGYEERIFVKGDRTADYGSVAQVMASLRTAGYSNLGLVTDLPDQKN